VTITTMFNAPHMLTQTVGDDCLLPEPCIAVSHDATPILVLAQGDSEILLNLESVNELCRLLKKVKGQAELSKGDANE